MKSRLYDSVANYIKDNKMLAPGDGVIIGVSGGADSIALLNVLLQISRTFVEKGEKALSINVVHVNHMIRGEEADRDERFVADFCKKQNVPFKVYREDIPQLAKEMHMTEEEAGRHFRYEVFEKEAERLETRLNSEAGASVVRIAVAHNKDDLAETVLYNMIRGSSLFGLSGILPVRGRIIRPLLMTRRAEIEEYLAELGQTFITDSTNMQTEYSRNKIRLSIMPELKEINDRAVDHIVDIALDSVRLRDDISTEIESSECLKCSEGESILNVERLLKLGQMAQGECILKALENVCGRRKDISREHIEAVQNLAGLETGKSVDLIYRMKAVKSYDEIIITKSEGSDPRNGSQEAPELGLGEIETEVIDYSDELEISKKEYTKMVDYDKIKNALVLRTPMPEDYIVINSTGGQKKLSRFLSHSKIEQAKRTHFPVVADGNEIVWAIGLRLSERYKVTAETRKVMVITFKKR